MQDNDLTASPQLLARLGGVLYLVIIVAGIFGEGIARGSLVVTGDATATADRIMASEFLWRFSVAGNLFHLVLAVVVMWVLYVLLRPVSREFALLAVFFNVVSIAIEAGKKFFLFAVLFLLGDADYLGAFTAEQLHAMAYVLLRADSYGFGISLVFFGCFCIVTGYLLFKSGYFPKLLGILMQLAGVCYLVNSFAMFLSPPVATLLFPAILLPSFIAELALSLWLIFKGVNASAWQRRIASRSRLPGATESTG